MGILKRQQVEQQQATAAQHTQATEKKRSQQSPGHTTQPQAQTSTPKDDQHEDTSLSPNNADDNWDWEAFLAGELDDRRQRDERRTDYRREGDHALIQTAEAEADDIRERAFQTGYQEGVHQAQEAIETLKAQFVELLSGHQQVIAEMIKHVGPLAVSVAEKILNVEISCDELMIERLTRETIQKAGRDAKSIMIRVHPQQVTIVRQIFRDFPPENLHAEITVVDDETVDLGSCMVESDSGLIDARFSTQLSILQKLLY
jgi:flagellar assembly protein FliH